MALFDDASLVVTPNGYKEGTLYSIKPTSGLGDMTVVRATTATRVNSAGLIELVPYNLFGYSEDFANAYWTKYLTSITSNVATAPNGTTTADLFTSTGSGYTYSSFISLSATSYTISVYAKKGNTNWSAITISNGITTDCTSWYNINSGTLGSTSGSITITNRTIEDAGNGWYRLTLTISLASAGSFIVIPQFVQANSGASTNGDTGYAWGAQLVTGTLPKDYLRTETRLNIPRLDYSNGTCPSLLVEPQRTNLFLRSQEFDNAAWAKAGTVTANTTISPDGTQNADTVTSIIFQQSFGTNVFTFSCYAKVNGGDGIFYIRVDIPATNQASFNLNNGTILSTPAGYTTSIENVGNGWYRCTMTTPSVNIINAVLVSANYGANPTYLWGAQLEAGSYPTSYIPTTSAAVTRNADVISKTGISSLIGQTEGTVFCEFQTLENLYAYIGVDDTTTTNRIIFFGVGDNKLYAQLRDATGTIFTQGTNVINGKVKAAISFNSSGSVFYANGVQIHSDLGASYSTLSQFTFNHASQIGAVINSAILFPTRLTNAELASLTTI